MRTTKQLLISLLTLLCCGTGMWASSIPGALSGRFTINASGEKVVFSQGNLQYVGTWQFAENQWDCFSTSQYNDHRDLFGWGTGDAPNKVSNNNDDYGTFTDWGTKAITNGGNTENSGWRTLTKDEWVYLFYSRENAATLFGFGRVNSMNGLIILPDNWTTPEGASFTASTTLGLTDQGSYYHNGNNDNYSHNTYTAEQWAVMESAGAVFLPAAAYRHGADSNIDYTDGGGFYWSSTPYDSDKAYYLNFYYNDLDPQFNEMRYGGRPVRLVRSSLDQDNEGYYLLGSVQDWKDFATLVQTTPAANAKMTADIDLGEDQTMIGSNNTYSYRGIFDGQGHTLTVAYNNTDAGLFVAPFSYIYGATIRNMHIAGTIQTACQNAGAVSKYAGSGNVMENVWCSLAIQTNWTANSGNWECCSGLVGSTLASSNASLNMKDCLFTGSVVSTSGDQSGCFVGYIDTGCSANISNCLSLGTFSYQRTSSSVEKYSMSIDNSYIKQFPNAIPTSMQVTAEQLADGTIAYKLQNNRTDLVWGQRIGIDPEPVLTNDENYRVYIHKSGSGYTNDPEEAYKGLQQDGDDNYLLGSLLDWQAFAELIQTTPAANAKMTADIDLGDDQTKIGSYATRYSGIFDGQGHMLTFNYNTSSMSIESGQSYLGAAPFRDIEGATIRNLHTAGSITADKIGASGLVGWAYGTNTIENCWSDVNIASSNNTADTFTGFVAFMYGTSISITDCIFTGLIQSTSKQSHSGFIGYHYSGTSALTNCLVILDEGSDTNIYDKWLITFFTFDRFASSDQSAGTYTNCYYYRDFGVAQGTKATAAQLADGTTATALQAGRAEEVWVQDPLTNQPMLKLFATYKVPSSGIGTFSAKAKFSVPDGLKAYYCKGYTDGQISAVAINGAVPANTGVLLKGEPGETYTLTGTNSEAATVMDNALVAVTEETFITQTVDIDAVNYTNFGLSGGVFKKVNSKGGTVKANRAYLQIPTSELPAAAEGIMLVWDEETDGIEIVQTSTVKSRHDDAWFTLDGRQLSGKPTAKGLYIVNGKKVIIK